jgi:hypothetical protein
MVDSLSQVMVYMTENLDSMRALWMSKL